MGSRWYDFPHDSGFSKRYSIHTDKREKWMQVSFEGQISFFGSKATRGAPGHPRMCVVVIEGKKYLRHRLMALACRKMTTEQFRDPTVVVMHKRRRQEDSYPDDSPENIEIGTQKDNRMDPGKKKTVDFAKSIRVNLVNISTLEKSNFPSILAAAKFLGENAGNLNRYLNGRIHTMPGDSHRKWVAEFDYEDAFTVQDAIEFGAAAKELRLSPSLRDPLVREVKPGLYVQARLKSNSHGYVRVKLNGGASELLHRLVFKTFNGEEFRSKLADLPTGSKDTDIQIDHIDGDSSNNSLENLRALTRKEHSRKHAFAVEWIIDDEENKVFDCAADAAYAVFEKNGVKLQASSIRQVCRGIKTRAGGHKFRWVNHAGVEEKRICMEKKRKTMEI